MKLSIISNGTTYALDNSNGIAVVGVTGLEPVKASITTTQNIAMEGMTLSNITASGRSISISLAIEGSEPSMVRRWLYTIARPMTEIDLLIDCGYATYRASGVVEDLHVDAWTKLQSAQIDILCESPWLESESVKIVRGKNTEPLFEFPFHNDEGETFIFGERSSIVQAVVEYSGEVQTGCTFSIIAGADILHPKIMNLSTGAFFGVVGTVPTGSELRVITEKGKKKVHVIRGDGTKSNFLSKRFEGSTWLELESGDNIFALTADQGAESAVFTIQYSDKYVGV